MLKLLFWLCLVPVKFERKCKEKRMGEKVEENKK